MRVKKEADFQNLDELLPLHPIFPLYGGVIYGSPKILVESFLVERGVGVRVVYLKFEGFGWSF